MIPSLVCKSDLVKNRLYLKISGSIAVAEARKFKRNLAVELARLKPGFTLLIDAREFEPVNNTAQDVVETIMEAIASAKPSRVARIVDPESALKAGHISRRTGYTSAIFETEMEAERFLNK